MNRTKKRNLLFTVLIVVIVACTLFGCSAKSTEEKVETLENEAKIEFEKLEGDADEIITAAKDEFSKWDSEAKAAVTSVENVTEEDIHEAVSYIDENIVEPFKNGEVTKKLAEYAAKLKYLGEKDATIADHEITKLGQNVYDYLQKVVIEGEEWEGKTANTIKTEIDKCLSTIKNDMDGMVSEFHSLVHK